MNHPFRISRLFIVCLSTGTICLTACAPPDENSPASSDQQPSEMETAAAIPEATADEPLNVAGPEYYHGIYLPQSMSDRRVSRQAVFVEWVQVYGIMPRDAATDFLQRHLGAEYRLSSLASPSDDRDARNHWNFMKRVMRDTDWWKPDLLTTPHTAEVTRGMTSTWVAVEEQADGNYAVLLIRSRE
ncbi:MAG: hypothetical protein WD534_11770 [Phycisphaeraceae bacterium]